MKTNYNPARAEARTIRNLKREGLITSEQAKLSLDELLAQKIVDEEDVIFFS